MPDFFPEYPVMNDLQDFGIEFAEPIELDGAEEYDVDPLDELTLFERGMYQYALDCDSRVRLHVGSDSSIIELFDDVAPILFELPRGIANLAMGKRFCWEIPELQQTVEFQPADDIVVCRMRGFAEVGSTPEHLVSKDAAVRVLAGFLKEVLRRAVRAGYVTESEASAFLEPVADLGT